MLLFYESAFSVFSFQVVLCTMIILFADINLKVLFLFLGKILMGFLLFQSRMPLLLDIP